MNKKLKLRFVCVIAIVSICMVFIFKTVQGHSYTQEKYKTVSVKEGDTLWTIVKDNCENYKDIRKAIYYIEKANGMASANITPGQDIKIPYEYIKK
jgi:LysM domain.